VHTPAGVIAADAALVTVPLGVLKRPDGLIFQPPLPARKRQAIKRLGFGCLNKVVMLFPYCFWGDKVTRSAAAVFPGLKSFTSCTRHTPGGAVLGTTQQLVHEQHPQP